MLFRIAAILMPVACSSLAPPVGAEEPRHEATVSQRLGVVPGLYQWRTGQRTRALVLGGGSGLALVTAVATGALAIYYGNQGEDWRGDYLDLPMGLPDEAYAEAYDTWQDYERRSDDEARQRNIALAALGALYAANWLDVLTSAQDGEARRTALLPVMARRRAGVQLVRRL